MHNKFIKSSLLCMGFPCFFCWHHINVDKHFMWPEREWNVPDFQFWIWMFCSPWVESEVGCCSPWAKLHRDHHPCRLVLQTYYTKEGEKTHLIFHSFFSYAFYSGKFFSGFDGCFHASALVYLKFDGEIQFISLRASHYWWMIIKMAAMSGWDYTAETTLCFGFV